MKRALIVLLVALGTLTACARQQPINNVDDAAIARYDGAEMSIEDVGHAIAIAGSRLGWQMKRIEPGEIKGTLNVREHRAVIDISYDTDSYSIDYVDSENLLYTAPDKIHRNYNRWIANLQQEINASVDALQME